MLFIREAPTAINARLLSVGLSIKSFYTSLPVRLNRAACNYLGASADENAEVS